MHIVIFPAEEPIPLDLVRHAFTRRWPVSARVVNFCRLGGALTALISVGDPQLWLLSFPLVMAGAFRLMQQWCWLPAIPNPEQRRKGLRALAGASFSVVLGSLALLLMPLLVVLFGALPALLLFVYVSLTGTHMPPRAQENLSIITAVILLVVGWCFLYCALHGYALRRFTRQWHRPLFFGMVACTSIALPVLALVAQKVSWSHTSKIPLQPLAPIIAQWIFAIVLVSQMGALFGKWLASSARSAAPSM